MDITIDNKSQKPIYEQLYEQIAAQILSGALPAEFCLPSIRTIAKELAISVITVKSAYEALERKGYIYTRAGKGSFVAEHSGTLKELQLEVARQRLIAELPFYRNLQITKEELIELIEGEYD